jgi:hypothetical protein
MKAPMTKDRYKTRVAKFFDFIGLDGKEGQTGQDKARVFASRGKEDINWAFSNVLKFIQFQKERVDRKEISGATVINYAKSICKISQESNQARFAELTTFKVRACNHSIGAHVSWK